MILSGPVAVEPGWLAQAETAYASGTKLAATRRGDPTRVTGRRGVSVVPVMGLLTRRETIFTQFFGGQTFTSIRRDFNAALDDRTSDTVLLYVDSPGGDAVGAMELSDEIRAARGRKRIVASVEGLGASAAYWIASAAAEVYASPSSEVGSIGTVLAHTDRSEAQRMAGLKTTLIFSGANKVLGNSFEPLSDQAKQVLQEDVDRVNDDFISTVARNRGVTRATVRLSYGDGLLLSAPKALKAGMIDGILTLDQALSSRGRPDRKALHASAIEAGMSRGEIALAEADRITRADEVADVRRRAMAALAATEHLERI